MRRELRVIQDDELRGAVDDAAAEPFQGLAAEVLNVMRHRMGDAETIRAVMANGWSNGYLYFAEATP